MSKKVLITGATGFIGGFLVEEAIRQQYEVIAAVRSSSNTSHLKTLPNVKIINFNFVDPKEIAATIDQHQIDFIINNAGLTRSKSEDKLNEVNAEYVKYLVDGISKATKDIIRIVHVSSLAAFGPADLTSNGIVSNTSQPRPVTMYGRSKLLGEKYLIKESPVPYAILRPTAVYGPKEKDLYTVFKMIKGRFQTKIGFGKQKLTFIYVKDLVRYMVNALEHGPDNAAYFISDQKHYTNHEFNETIRKKVNVKTLKLSIPLFIVKMLAYLSEWWGNLTNTFPPLNIDKYQELKANSWVCDTNPNGKLNYSPQYSLDRGIHETVLWYKENNWL